MGTVRRLLPSRAPDRLTTCPSESRWLPRTSIFWMSKRAEVATTHTEIPRTSTATVAVTAPGTRRLLFTEPSHQTHLGLQLQSEALPDPALNHRDQAVDVLRRGTRRGDHEIGMLIGYPGPADGKPLRARGLDQPGGMISWWVLEHAAAVGLGERLRGSPPLPGLVHVSSDVGGIARPQPHDGRRHDSPVRKGRVPVFEPCVARGDPACLPLLDNEDLDGLQDLVEGMAVGAGVHPHAPTERSRNGHAKFESGEPVGKGNAGKGRQGHGGAYGKAVTVSGHPAEGPSQTKNQTVEAFIGDEEIGALSDH